MNKSQYTDKVHLSQYEPTTHTAVNIRMLSKRPKNFSYKCLIYYSKKPVVGDLTVEEGKKMKDKPKKKAKYTTFIVFSSSETIITGRYITSMRDMYTFFVDEAKKNRKMIEEKPDTHTEVSKVKRIKI